MFKSSVVELGEPKGSVLFNLAAFQSGSIAVLDRIPSGQNGIYAWFRSFEFSESPEEFAKELVSTIESPKFQSRSGDIAPYYEVNISSKSKISSGKKIDLVNALKDEAFSSALRYSLQWSILLQAPLYIGKSTDLRSRIEQHMKPGSVLRERLMSASIDIDRTSLLVIPVPKVLNEKAVEEGLLTEEDGNTASELLFEEVFSRLFNPLFTIRLG